MNGSRELGGKHSAGGGGGEENKNENSSTCGARDAEIITKGRVNRRVASRFIPAMCITARRMLGDQGYSFLSGIETVSANPRPRIRGKCTCRTPAGTSSDRTHNGPKN